MTKEDSPRVLVPPPLIFAAFLIIGLLFQNGIGASDALRITAVALGLVGLVLIALALGLFRVKKTRAEPWRPASALVVSGIFRVTRNPMYLGMAMLSLALALFFASPAGAVLTLIAVVVIDRGVVRREEAYLSRRFGKEYATYCGEVRRWL